MNEAESVAKAIDDLNASVDRIEGIMAPMWSVIIIHCLILIASLLVKIAYPNSDVRVKYRQR